MTQQNPVPETADLCPPLECAGDLAILGNRVESAMGLRRGRRPEDLWRALRELARQEGEPLRELLSRLAASPLSREDTDRLAPHLTVGETYFFRDMETLGVLRDRVFPELTRRGGTVRIWCAGCSSGEEAYTVAMLAQEVLPPERLEILGTDLNPRSLRKARKGHYTRWSFRGVPSPWVERFFTRLPEGVRSVKPRFRQGISFREGNLLDPASPFPDGRPADVILCRNVLIYFEEAAIRRVLSLFRQTLSPEGWLVVAPAEAPLVQGFGFHPLGRTSAFLHPSRRASGETPREREYALEGFLPPPLPEELPTALPFGPEEDLFLPPSPPQPAAPPVPPSPEEDLLATARRKADAGLHEEALCLCSQAMERDRTDPTPYYLSGVIHQERGATQEARNALRRAVYLDPSFVAAHHALASLAPDRESEARHLRNARELLLALPEDEVVPESGGLTASALLELLHIAPR